MDTDGSRRSRVNEAQSAEEKKISTHNKHKLNNFPGPKSYRDFRETAPRSATFAKF